MDSKSHLTVVIKGECDLDDKLATRGDYIFFGYIRGDYIFFLFKFQRTKKFQRKNSMKRTKTKKGSIILPKKHVSFLFREREKRCTGGRGEKKKLGKNKKPQQNQ